VRLARFLIVLASAVCLASIGTAQSTPGADSPELHSLRRVLDPRRRSEHPQAQLVSEIVGLGPRVAPLLVGLLTGALPGTDWEESGLSLEEARAAQSDEDALLCEALRGLPKASVAHALSDTCGGTATIDRRLVGLHLLAEVGEGAEAVGCWRELGSGIEEIHLRRAYVRAQLESALARCLERSAASFEPLRRGLRDWEARLYPAIVQACADAGRRPGVEVLSSLRGISRELDLELVRELPKLAAATRGGLDELELSWLRGFLDDADPVVRSDALLGLGRACDPCAPARLVDALADSDERVAQAALWSLKQVSGVRLSGNREIWQGWLEGESRWYDSGRAQQLQALESKDPALVVAALQELTRHPLFRHENARAVSVLCASENADVLRAACAALRAFDSMAGADALLTLLGHEDEALRALAHKTLQALTGQTLAPQPELWQALLAG
jgi:hypothetical protein